MRIEIHGPDTLTTAEACHLRAVLFNDGYEPVAISRNAFTGPSVQTLAPGGYPQPASVEPTYGHADEPLTLQPFTLYGRERTFTGLPAGEMEVSASYHPEGSPPITISRRITVVAAAT
jgi:hypothetical protein